MDVGGVVVSEVLLSEKQHIVTVKIDPYKIVPQNYFFDNKKLPGTYFTATYFLLDHLLEMKDSAKTLYASISKLYRRCGDGVKVLWCH